jgi:hypothetical protein
MKFNIDFSFIIAILVLVQLFLLSFNVSGEDTEETSLTKADNITKVEEIDPKSEKIANSAECYSDVA